MSVLKFQTIFSCLEIHFSKSCIHNRNEIINCQNIFLVHFCPKQCESKSFEFILKMGIGNSVVTFEKVELAGYSIVTGTLVTRSRRKKDY